MGGGGGGGGGGSENKNIIVGVVMLWMKCACQSPSHLRLTA